jgi:ABC-type methionine transport system ATPase subunit
LQRSLRPEPLAAGRALLRVGSSGIDQYSAVLAPLADPQWQAQIVHAEVDRIQAHSIGTVTFSVRYRGAESQSALLSLLEQHRAQVEVLGYLDG